MSSADSPVAEEIRRLEERRARDPRAHTFARLADLYRKDGRPERALDVVEAGLVHHPHYLNARIVHARVLRELGRVDEAASAFRRVLEIDAENLVAKQALRELRNEGALEAIRTLRAEGSRPRPGRGSESPGEGAGGARTPAGRSVADPQAGRRPPRLEGDPGEEAVEPAATRAPAEPRAPAESPASQAPRASEESQPPARPSADRAAPGGKQGVATATLAALYARQGLYEDAIGMYERLLARDPYDARLARALAETRRLATEGGPAAPGAGTEPPDEVVSGSAPTGEGATGPRASSGGPRADADDPIAAPRPEGARRPASPSSAVPTRDTRVGAGRSGTSRGNEPTIRALLADLLEGRGPVPAIPSDEPLARLRRWLRAARDAEG